MVSARATRAREQLIERKAEVAQDRRNEYRETAWSFLEKAKESISTGDLRSAKYHLSKAIENQFADSTADSSELEEELQGTGKEIKRIEDAELAPRRKILERAYHVSSEYWAARSFALANGFEVAHSEFLTRLTRWSSTLSNWVTNQSSWKGELRQLVYSWPDKAAVTRLDKYGDLDDLVSSAESEMASYADEWQEELAHRRVIEDARREAQQKLDDEQERKDNLQREGKEEFHSQVNMITKLTFENRRAVSAASSNYAPLQPSPLAGERTLEFVKTAIADSLSRDRPHFDSVENQVKALVEKLMEQKELRSRLEVLHSAHLVEREEILLEIQRADAEVQSCKLPEDYWWGEYSDRRADLDDRVARLEGIDPLLSDRLHEADRSYSEQFREAVELTKGEPVRATLIHKRESVTKQILSLCDPRKSGTITDSSLRAKGFGFIFEGNIPKHRPGWSIFFHINDIIGEDQDLVRKGCSVRYKASRQTTGPHRGKMKATQVEHNDDCGCRRRVLKVSQPWSRLQYRRRFQ